MKDYITGTHTYKLLPIEYGCPKIANTSIEALLFINGKW